MMIRELLQQALDALEVATTPLAKDRQEVLRAIAGLREALAAPEPEPVAEVYRARYGRRARYIGVDDVRKLNGVALPPLGTKLYAAPPAAPASQWMPIETAPKDGTPVLLLTNERWKDCRPGTQFVGINRGNLSEWCFYAPVGMGGIPDAWLDGWTPLPAAPDHLHDIAEKVAPPAAPAPAAPVPDGMATNADEVICPNCAHQFRAIPENVQSLLLASGHEPPFTTPPAAPVVPQPAQRTADCLMCGHCAATGERVAKPAVPLTDEQIRSMWKSSEFRGNGGQVDWFCEGIRAAEAHHGITGASK